MTNRMRAPEAQKLSFEYDLDAPPEKVWRALTVPALVERWLRPAEAEGAFVAELSEAEPPHRVSWRWQEPGAPEGRVTFTLAPNGEGGTWLRLVHQRQVEPAPVAANTNVMLALAA